MPQGTQPDGSKANDPESSSGLTCRPRYDTMPQKEMGNIYFVIATAVIINRWGPTGPASINEFITIDTERNAV